MVEHQNPPAVPLCAGNDRGVRGPEPQVRVTPHELPDARKVVGREVQQERAALEVVEQRVERLETEMLLGQVGSAPG